MIVDEYGKVVQKIEYSPFGKIKGDAKDVMFGFTGREYDPESGLYFYRARYYNPEVGRFISRDPIGLKGGINLYVYVKNNPINFVDPLGLVCVDTQSNEYLVDLYKQFLSEAQSHVNNAILDIQNTPNIPDSIKSNVDTTRVVPDNTFLNNEAGAARTHPEYGYGIDISDALFNSETGSPNNQESVEEVMLHEAQHMDYNNNPVELHSPEFENEINQNHQALNEYQKGKQE